MKKSKSAFTLVEILIVILIIGLLFVFLVPKINVATVKAKEAGVQTDMRSYQIAFESVAKEHAGFGYTSESEAIKALNACLDEGLKIGTSANEQGYYEAVSKTDHGVTSTY